MRTRAPLALFLVAGTCPGGEPAPQPEVPEPFETVADVIGNLGGVVEEATAEAGTVVDGILP